TAIGGSPRNVAPVIPIIVADVGFVIGFAFTRTSPLRKRTIARALAALVWTAAIIGVLVASNHSARRIKEYAEVERLLTVHSKSDALKIYTDDFDFYFPWLHYQTPRVSGGWQEVGLQGYLQEFPHLRDSSALALHDDLVRSGIRWAMFRTPPYDPRGDRSARSDTSLFRLTYQTSMHKIYFVE
ncbi:MAG TPA: hypothetical protein VFD13_04065, partial [Candidatus Kapabacteria bacterium]|nr:hypothetical protein [Candidatus Kapabacteria bacterium]